MRIRETRYLPLLILLFGVLAYANSFQGTFVFDDSRAILDNSRIRHVLPHGRTEWFGWRPFAVMTFALNYATGRLNPADYHATNLLIHLTAGLLLYGVVRRTLMLPRMADRFGRHAAQIAFSSSAIWTVHPLTTSSVTYICQRYESLMGMFYLLALYCVICGNSSPRRRWWYVLAIVACMLGISSKEVAITAPVLILVYDRIFLSQSFRETFSRRWQLYTGLAGTWVVFGLLMSTAASVLCSIMSTGEGLPSISYALTQCEVVAHYLRLSIWPYPLCMDYDWPAVGQVWDAIPSLMLMCTLGLATLLALRCCPPAGFLGLWFFVILSPTSSLVTISDYAFEQRMYLPLASVVTGVVAGFYDLLNRLSCKGVVSQRPGRLLATGIPLVAIIILAFATYCRNRVYYSEEATWRDVIEKRPHNLRAYDNLATVLYSNHRHEEAIKCCAEMLNRLPDLENIEHCEILRREGKPGEENLFQKVFFYSGAHNTIGLALCAQGKFEEAMEHFKEGVRLAPGNYRAQSNLASMLFKLGRTDEAIMNWNEVLKIMPGDPNTHRCLAEAFLSLGNVAAAVERYNTVLELRPDDIRAQTCLAWILATSSDSDLRDGRRAVDLAEDAAITVDYRSAYVLDVLSAAYAEVGEFERAAQTAQRAIRLAQEDSNRAAIEKRLELYLQAKPYRELKLLSGSALEHLKPGQVSE